MVWAPNSIDWAVAALAVSYAGGVLVPANSRYTGHEVADIVDRTRATLVVVADGFLGRTQIADLEAASDLPSVRQVVDLANLAWVRDLGDDVAERADRGAGRPVSPGRRRRHPVHVRHHRTAQGRDERPPADDRRRRRVGQPRRGHLRGPLPRGEPVLPLLRLQDRHRRRAADRRDALPRGGLRRRRDDAPDPGRRHHRASRVLRRSTSRCSARRTAATTTSPRCGSR